MKNILFVFILFVLYSCTNESLISIDESPKTRSINDISTYYFSSSNKEQTFDYQGGFVSSNPILTSYMVNDIGTNIDILPQVKSKPSWVNGISVFNIYEKTYIVYIALAENTSSTERVGTIILSQPESNKTLSFQLIQESKNNVVTVNVSTLDKNLFEFKASTQYPVKGDYLLVKVPYEVYNDGDKMGGNVYINIPKGSKSNTVTLGFISSPIVNNYGDLKGCRLLSPVTLSPENDGFYDYIVAP